MKILTHNLLVCNKKSCANTGVKNFPLYLSVDKWADYADEDVLSCKPNVIRQLCGKLDWQAFRETLL